MPHIDVVADLNFEGDGAGVLLARVPAGCVSTVGTVLAASTLTAWSQVRVEAVGKDGWLGLRLRHGSEVG
ncbi:hypothetical protein [Blastococcus montanus]|uniref:hypothetical protein n=1 Tax=Blastococcus montanus TaxID=3144973 RepID=UPI003208F0E7